MGKVMSLIDAQTIVDAINALKTGLSVSQAQAIIDSLGEHWKNVSGLKQKYHISNDVLHTNPAERYTHNYPDESMRKKLLEITIDALYPSPVTLRIKYEMKSHAGHTRIYKNDSAHGSDHYYIDDQWHEITEDLEFAQGDRIQIYGWSNNGTINTYARNLRVCGFVTQDLAHAIAENDCGVNIGFSARNTYP
ncbi:MAG: hypothetical protein DRP15_04050 [Candidatus Aenigmatarchaeota archaeon]|nr:MAG: hypothetical protein DRP15_04050 [Candidatus Aenigmarchaeota archaeon]